MAGNGEGLDRDHTAKPLAFPATQHTEKSWELALNILAPGQAHAGKMVDKLSLEDLLDVLALADAFKITSLLKHCFSVLERRGSAMGLVTKLELGEKYNLDKLTSQALDGISSPRDLQPILVSATLPLPTLRKVLQKVSLL